MNALLLLQFSKHVKHLSLMVRYVVQTIQWQWAQAGSVIVARPSMFSKPIAVSVLK